MLNYLRFDIFCNHLYIIGICVARQRRGVAIGGPCSARCAQPYCLYKEVLYRQAKIAGKRLLKSLLQGALPWDLYRYLDIFVGSVSLRRVQRATHAVYGSELQQEGQGQVLPALEAVLSLVAVTGRVGLQRKSKLNLSLPPCKQLSPFPDRHALQAHRLIKKYCRAVRSGVT